ncbi:MAG: hypothetical protein JST68_11565 [Bacteroidetes bacterium]|nr:hypothetical protein [Bacteroidota bacterium]
MDKEKRYDRFWLTCIIAWTFVLVFLQMTQRRVIYLNIALPFLVYLCGSIIGLWFVYLIRRYIFLIPETPRTFFFVFVNNAKNIFFSLTIFGWAASWGFYFFNVSYSEHQPEGHERCKVSRIITKSSGSNNLIEFMFHGEEKSFSGYLSDKDYWDAEKEKRYDKYFVNIDYRKGLFSSYIVEGWDFENGK